MHARKNAPAGNRRARPNRRSDCPLTATDAAVGGKWKLTIVYWLARGPLHFAQVRRHAVPISHKVLTEQLRELEADGIVARLPQGQAPAPVLYRLTDYGRTLRPLVECARVWGLGHLQRRRGGDATDAIDCSTAINLAEVQPPAGTSSNSAAPSAKR